MLILHFHLQYFVDSAEKTVYLSLGSAWFRKLHFHKEKLSPTKNLVYEVSKKIEAEEELDLVLVILRMRHNSDLSYFLKRDRKTFKSYVKMCAHFKSRVHNPQKRDYN